MFWEVDFPFAGNSFIRKCVVIIDSTNLIIGWDDHLFILKIYDNIYNLVLFLYNLSNMDCLLTKLFF